jgi:hypothetical protein
MADRPPVTNFNPEGTRFVVEHPEPGYQTYKVYRWDPPAGYWPVAELFGMQGVYALTMAKELAAWYEERYPLPDIIRVSTKVTIT